MLLCCESLLFVKSDARDLSVLSEALILGILQHPFDSTMVLPFLPTGHNVARSRQSSERCRNTSVPEHRNAAPDNGEIAVLQIPALSMSSETETYSGLSYLVFYNNWKGIYSQLIPFLSQNSTLQAAMGAQVQKAFGDAFACLPIQTKVKHLRGPRPSHIIAEHLASVGLSVSLTSNADRIYDTFFHVMM